jgi:hypothetical protein
VLDDQVQAVIAFTLMDRIGTAFSGARASVEQARLAVLVRTMPGLKPRPTLPTMPVLKPRPTGRWAGEIVEYPADAVQLRAGRIDARFGESTLTFARGSYHLELHVGDLHASLELQPAARPAVTQSIPLGREAPMQWFVVPRLDANGEISIDGARHRLHHAPAYHDHNWGPFAWGGDFAWEWAIVLPANAAWTLIYYRITDRARHHALSQGVLVWEGEHHRRTFREGEVTSRTGTRPRPVTCLRLPRVLQLAMPGDAADLPGTLQVNAASGADRLSIAFTIDDCAQLGVPHDEDDGLTLIAECHARASVDGWIGDRRVSFDAAAVVEFNRGRV